MGSPQRMIVAVFLGTYDRHNIQPKQPKDAYRQSVQDRQAITFGLKRGFMDSWEP